MYRQVITPDKNNHSVELPEELFGKKVEVIIVEIGNTNNTGGHPTPPTGKKVLVNELLETFGADPGFPTIEELRSKSVAFKMVVFDTNILIELYRGNDSVRQRVEQIESDIYYLSSISIAEFIVGAKSKTDLERIERQLEKYTELPVNSDITEIFLKLFRTYTLSHRPEIADTLIAATAIYYDLPLYTLNKKHFQFIPGIGLL